MYMIVKVIPLQHVDMAYHANCSGQLNNTARGARPCIESWHVGGMHSQLFAVYPFTLLHDAMSCLEQGFCLQPHLVASAMYYCCRRISERQTQGLRYLRRRCRRLDGTLRRQPLKEPRCWVSQ